MDALESGVRIVVCFNNFNPNATESPSIHCRSLFFLWLKICSSISFPFPFPVGVRNRFVHENNIDTTITIDWMTKVFFWNDGYELPSKLWTHNNIDSLILLSIPTSIPKWWWWWWWCGHCCLLLTLSFSLSLVVKWNNKLIKRCTFDSIVTQFDILISSIYFICQFRAHAHSLSCFSFPPLLVLLLFLWLESSIAHLVDMMVKGSQLNFKSFIAKWHRLKASEMELLRDREKKKKTKLQY